jgi:hypothetical protein
MQDWRTPTNIVGAGLPAKTAAPLTSPPTDPPQSRASSLPQGIGGECRIAERSKNCGSGLAREGGAIDITANWPTAIASKPAPTGDWRRTPEFVPAANHCGSEPARDGAFRVDVTSARGSSPVCPARVRLAAVAVRRCRPYRKSPGWRTVPVRPSIAGWRPVLPGWRAGCLSAA